MPRLAPGREGNEMENNLLLNALIYLAAAVITVPVAKRLGLGAVLGYLSAGIAIGPFGFGLIREVEDILHFSEFGVVLLLFLIGLELEPKRLWSMRKPIFGWGSAQVILVATALCTAGILAGIGWKVALIAALGLSLSSTAIALATLDERNLMTTPAGSAGFSILLFQDIAAIPMIAIVPVPSRGLRFGKTSKKPRGRPLHGKGRVLIFGSLLILMSSMKDCQSRRSLRRCGSWRYLGIRSPLTIFHRQADSRKRLQPGSIW